MPVTAGFLVSLKQASFMRHLLWVILNDSFYNEFNVNLHFLSFCYPVFNHFLNIIIWSCCKIFCVVTSGTRMLTYNFLTVWWISSFMGVSTDRTDSYMPIKRCLESRLWSPGLWKSPDLIKYLLRWFACRNPWTRKYFVSFLLAFLSVEPWLAFVGLWKCLIVW